jgi:hypothetical protein
MVLRRVLALLALLCAAAPAGASARALTVDRASVGGRCSDAREARQVSVRRPLCTIERALALRPAGGRVRVRRGVYPALVVDGVRPRRLLTIRSFGRERAHLRGLTVDLSAAVRVAGFRISGLTRVERSQRITVARNDMTPHGVVAGGSSHLRFERNHIHDLTIDMQPAGVPGHRCHRFGPAAGMAPHCGFGFRMQDVTDSVIAGNEIDHVPADGIQGSGLARVEISGNFFHDIDAFIDPLEHSDGIQLLGTNDAITVSGNRFADTRGLLAQPMPGNPRWPGTATRLVVRDNAFVRIRHWAMHLVDAAGARLENNTVWLAGRAVWLTDSDDVPVRMTGVQLRGNVFSELRDDVGAVTASDGNVIMRGPLPGPTDVRAEPAFVDGQAGDLRLLRGPGAGAPAGVAALPAGRWTDRGTPAVTARARRPAHRRR